MFLESPLSTTATNNPWVSTWALQKTANFRLFCFPHAGGNSSLFTGWPDLLPQNASLLPVQLPGRQERIRERAIDRMSELVNAIADGLAPLLNGTFVFFGHSLGGLISFELARHLRHKGQQEPAALFLSGCRGPHIPLNRPMLHLLPDNEFIDVLQKRYDGIAPQIAAEKELMQLLLPTIRADVKCFETYEFHSASPLACPISVFGGSQDNQVSVADLNAWRQHTTGQLSLRMYPGDHFYVAQHYEAIVKVIGQQFRD